MCTDSPCVVQSTYHTWFHSMLRHKVPRWNIIGSHLSEFVLSDWIFTYICIADCKVLQQQAEQWITKIDLPDMNLIIFPTSACPSSLFKHRKSIVVACWYLKTHNQNIHMVLFWFNVWISSLTLYTQMTTIVVHYLQMTTIVMFKLLFAAILIARRMLNHPGASLSE